MKKVIWTFIILIWLFNLYQLGKIIYIRGYTDGFIEGDNYRTKMVIKTFEELKKELIWKRQK